MKRLSSKQQHIIDFVRRFCADRGYPPTIRDIASGCGISSTSVVDYNLDILERNEYIRRYPGVSRGIELRTRSRDLQDRLRVPIIGQISAGEPIPVPTPDTWDVTASSETLEVIEDLSKSIQRIMISGNSYDMGFLHGSELRNQIEFFINRLFFHVENGISQHLSPRRIKRIASCFESAIRRYAPHVYEEMIGIAEDY